MSKFLSIGKLKHKIAIQTYIEEPGENNSTEITWNTIAELWAYIEPLKGNYYFNARQIDKTMTHKITIRYYKTQEITTENWILYEGKRFRIRAVKNIFELRRYLELMCEEEQKALDYFEAGNDSAGDVLAEVMIQ